MKWYFMFEVSLWDLKHYEYANELVGIEFEVSLWDLKQINGDIISLITMFEVSLWDLKPIITWRPQPTGEVWSIPMGFETKEMVNYQM